MRRVKCPARNEKNCHRVSEKVLRKGKRLGDLRFDDCQRFEQMAPNQTTRRTAMPPRVRYNSFMLSDDLPLAEHCANAGRQFLFGGGVASEARSSAGADLFASVHRECLHDAYLGEVHSHVLISRTVFALFLPPFMLFSRELQSAT